MRKSYGSVWALGGLAGLWIAAPAMAQTGASALSIVDTPSIAQRSNYYTVDATFSTDYHSNVAGGSAAAAKARGLQQNDVIFTPSALVEVLHAIGRQSVFVTGSVGYNFYAQNSIFNREHIDLNGGLNGQLGSCRATLTGGYLRRQQEIQDLTTRLVQDATEVSSVGLEGACGRGFGFSPNFSVNQSWSTNSSSQLATSDYSSIGGSGGISYQTPKFGVLTLFGQAQSTDFTNRLVPTAQGAQHDGFDTYGGGVRYSRQLGARIQGTVSLSYTSVKPYLSGTRGFDGPTYSADLTYRASSRLNFHGNFTRDVQASNVLNSTYFIETKESVDGTYRVGSRITLVLGASQSDRNFKGPVLSPQTDLTNDHLETVYGSATYRLRRLYFTLSASQDQRSANVVGLGYGDTRVGLTAGANF
jgi:hypothetical protein